MDRNVLIQDQDHSMWVIQVWLKQIFASKRALKVLRHHREKVSSVLKLLNNARESRSMEDAQKLLFPETSVRLVVQVLSVFPKDPLAKERNSDAMLTRKILSSILISSFGEEMLGNSSPGAARNTALKIRAIAVQHSATILHRQLNKLLSFLVNHPEPKLRQFRRLLWQFQFSTRNYLEKFNAWKTLDEEILQQSMEETFAQSYQNFLMAKVAFRQGNADETIVAAADEQCRRLREVLRKILGPNKSASRIEEITASIESSFPEYLRLFGDSIQSSGANTPMVKQETANNSDSAPATTSSSVGPSTSLVDTTELRRTLSPIPGEATVNASTSQNPESSVATNPTASNESSNNQPSASTISDAESARYLQLLSKLAGIENERLAHELTLDKFYRLPDKRPLSAKGKPSIVHAFRSKMLNVLADKLINALRRSNVHGIDEISVGMIVPVKIMTKSRSLSDPSASSAAVASNSNNDFYFLSAEIVNIKNPTSMDVDHKYIDSASESATAYKLFSVRYLSDDSREDDVPFSRIKFADEPADARPFIAALSDIMQSVASFIPNRSDLRQQLANLFDADLLIQVFMQGTVIPQRDILPIFLGLQRIVLSLQAEYRLEDAVAWLKAFEEMFSSLGSLEEASPPPSLSSGAISPQKLWQQAKQRYFPLTSADKDKDLWLALIPFFLEHTTENLEDIQRDMANYYISQLVPMLQTHGRSFLAQRFKERLMQGLVSLDRTALWLQLHVSTDATLSTLLEELPAPLSQLWQSVRPSLGIKAMNAVLKDCEVVILPNSPENTISSPSSTTNEEVISLDMLATLSSSNNVFAETSPASAASTTSSSVNSGVKSREDKIITAIVAHALCSLLQMPVRLDTPSPLIHATLPETLAWDAKRLAEARDLIDTIALESGIVLSLRQILQQRYRIAHREDEEMELQHRLDVLLRSHQNEENNTDENDDPESSSSSSSPVSMGNLVAEVVRYVEHAIRRSREGDTVNDLSGGGAVQPQQLTMHGGLATYDVREVTALVEKLLSEVVVRDQSPVLQLFSKRLYRLLLRACLGQPFQHKLKAFFLHSKAQERNLKQLITSVSNLCAHTIAVHGDVYKEVLRALGHKLLLLETQQTSPPASSNTDTSSSV